ncbi:aminoacyl-tRNA hydrolase [bacterium]|jgi:PTH1 family peptidyl-tRNA hydrolase|nr:aminoacyl-tRNA hydrolase [bacterium]MDP6571710.1 aminoacyl-tRNA hydrolase [Patescibacteria group bacterium]MDP6756067.1 aminoacyl-tRNA hydrolase [Patescibacteria group bacterium]|tara:strand:+ start:8752 stop:9309 length:558 start_codon:yes stop_codon:yes gene_type:complete
MKLIIGLGNPGKEYEKTRHNTGFRAVDVLVDKGDWKMNDKFNAEIAETKIGKSKTILAKPQTFMNKSGDAVGKIARYYKIKKENILIIFDDIDLLVGTLRLRPDGSSGGHQGMQSVLTSLKSDKIARLKIGVADQKAGKQRISSEDYILKPPSKSGEIKLKKSLKLVVDIIDEWLSGNDTTTMAI